MASDLDMGNKRILNLPPPKDPKESTENYNDFVTDNLYDLMKDIGEKTDKRYLKIEGTNILKGRLHLGQHRINDLTDAVTKRYVAARGQALTDTNNEIQPVGNIVEAYNKIYGVIDNQILLLKYGIDGQGE